LNRFFAPLCVLIFGMASYLLLLCCKTIPVTGTLILISFHGNRMAWRCRFA